MTVLDRSSTDLLSELELGARKPRKVSVRRQPQGTVDERLAQANLDKVAQAVKDEVSAAYEVILNALKSQHIIETEEAKHGSHELGVIEGRREMSQEYDASFDDDVNSRVCDRDRKMPWSVGIIVAGEQHRLLQALADYLEGFDQPGLNATGFARTIKLPWYPEHTPAPEAITSHNCEHPPMPPGKTQDDMNFSPHWTYYLDQSEND